uniref:Netrin module non-TIMP type domain-containing protein n=1 Tax=Eptatretus burgeri TaxID=7764 RepID=A0A8C4PWZ6_EPTBU
MHCSDPYLCTSRKLSYPHTLLYAHRYMVLSEERLLTIYEPHIHMAFFFPRDNVPAVHVRSGGVRARGCRGARVAAHVERVLRGGGGPVRTGSAILHSDTPCVCPSLRPAREYLLLCDTDSTHSRMMLRNGCVAEMWNETWTKKVKAWEKLRLLRKGASERHSWYKAKTVYIRRRRGDQLPS